MRSGGMDLFYIDESHDRHVFVVTSICVPFLRCIDSRWQFVWVKHLDGAREWRRRIAATQNVPTSKELHGLKLASGRGNYNKGLYSFDKPKACAVYRRILEDIDFLPDKSIMSVAVSRSTTMYGHTQLEAAMFGLFQRMRRRCERANTNAMTFFDQGHPEYRKLYRKAQRFLPTGSNVGSWASGDASKNMPLDMFIEDGNEKDSKYCMFTQLADLIAYAVFLKMKAASGNLEEWQSRVSAGNIYESIPTKLLNTAASNYPPQDAIVRIK